MQILISIGVVLIGYVLGSIPFGLLIVKIKTGKDIRNVASGRTGGTNAMRAAGFGAGLSTAILDILKGAVAAWVSQAISPENYVIHILGPLAAILGHNYSVFLAQRDASGRLRFHGGAAGLWWPTLPIVFLSGALVFFTIGFASVITIAVALFITIIFSIRAYLGLMPPIEVAYGIIAEILLLWALRPNIQKLLAGNERIVKYSLHGWLRARTEHGEESN